MNDTDPNYNILILAPVGQDAQLAQQVLKDSDIGSEVLKNIDELCSRLRIPAAAVLITEEALTPTGQILFKETLKEQPTWSDIPIILISAGRLRTRHTKHILEMFESVGNISVLERPFSIISLVAILNTAIRARKKQYHNKELIAALNREINSKEEFLSIASHELKTPLTALKLQFQMKLFFMKKGAHTIYSAEAFKTFLTAADNQVNKLSRLVDDMLDTARVESGKLSLMISNCELGEIITTAVDTFPDLKKSGPLVKINVSEKIHGNWDKFRIEQVITNLVSNAIKYGNQKSITVSAHRIDNNVVVEVKDNGPGISLEDQKRVFLKFERAKSTDHIQGLGLGLYICKQIMEMHQGTLWVESTPGQGSAFKMKLPVS
jgi:signal transduction histidine kinase